MTGDRKKINRIILAVIFVAYVVFNGLLLIRHEQWRDEANVWLMAGELSPMQLFGEIRYQGHPCLWYLLVMPFAKLGLPFQTIGVISLGIMTVTAGIFVWKTPFSVPVKAVCLFSPVFTYFYADIARNYCLIALILMLLGLLYPERNERCVLYGLLLGLLVQADTIAIVSAGMISLMWLCENLYSGFCTRSFTPVKNVMKGVWIPLASLFLWIAQFYQVSDSPVYQVRDFGIGEFLGEVKNFSYHILIRMTGRGQSFCLVFFALFFLMAVLVSMRLKDAGAFLVMAAAFLFQAVFSAVVYQLHIWHFISLCFVFLWMVWVWYQQREEKYPGDKAVKVLLGGFQMLLLALSASMFLNWNSDKEPSSLDNALNGEYSDGVHAADYIKENIPKDAVIVSANVPFASTVLAYLDGYDFYYAGSRERTSYADWSEKQNRSSTFRELTAWAEQKFPEIQFIYLLNTEDSCLSDEEGELGKCEILYQTPGETVRGEEYTIYKIPLQR